MGQSVTEWEKELLPGTDHLKPALHDGIPGKYDIFGSGENLSGTVLDSDGATCAQDLF
jgi:hypothetical protein